jgi:hypothetical protein
VIPPPPAGPTERVPARFDGPPGDVPGWPRPGGPGVRWAAGRVAGVALLFLALAIVSGATTYLLAGGRWAGGGSAATIAPPVVTRATATQPQAAATQPPPAQAPAARAPAPTMQPTLSTPAESASAPPAQPQSQPPAKPTTVPPPPTVAPQPPATPTSPPAAAKPANQPAAPQPATNPAADPRKAQIEGRVREYFDALRAEDFARAQQVCCTPAWRARYPLAQWERNFDGVSDLRLINEPRYVREADEAVVVDTDYTFVSSGTRRNFTIRWTFTPVGSEWLADIAEATPL